VLLVHRGSASAYHNHVSPDSFAILSFAHRSFDLTFLSCNHQVCCAYLFCLGTYWTASTEQTFCYSHVDEPPVVKQPWEFFSECVCDLGVGGILNWTDRQISGKKERTRLPTEDVICVIPNATSGFGRREPRDTWWMTSIQRPESSLVI